MPVSLPWPSGPTVGPLLISLATAAVAGIVVGWTWGYRNLDAYAAFWLLLSLTLFAAATVSRRLFQPLTLLDSAIAVGVTVFAAVVACGLLLGLIGGLRLTAYLGAFALASVASRFLAVPTALDRGDPGAASRGVKPPMILTAAIVAALAVFAVAFGVAHAPLTLYDSLSYHLFFPARWLQEHRLSIIPTPFSDEAQAYAPLNGELFLLWLMLPFHGDLLARMGQLPFAALAAVTLYALGRRLGARPEHAVYPPAFFLLSRPVVEQAIGANVDLVCAATFLTSLYLGLVAIEQGRPRDWALWGVSVGLYAGSKYLALVYLPVLLVLALIPGPRGWRGQVTARLWAVPGLMAFGLPWYLRNWIAAGSPIYPASLQVAGLTLARGAFDRAAMLNSVFHTNDASLFPVMAAHALGPTLFLVWLPVAVLGGVRLARRGWWPHAAIAAMPVLMAVLYWFGLPVNVDSRFLMPAIAPALVPFAFTFGTRRRANGALHAAYLLAMVWLVVGRRGEIPARVPWFMAGWLSLDGLVAPAYVGWWAALAVGLAAVMAAAVVAERRGWSAPRRWALPVATALLAVTTVTLAIGGEHWCIPARCEFLAVTSPHIGMDLIYGWRWVADHARDTTVAYTGINLPYPLTGRQLTNRVVYVNIDGRRSWRFHDYDRAYRSGAFTPAPPLLATGSGELLPAPAASSPRHNHAARPRYERMEGFRDGWVENLRRLHVGFLFVTALSPYEINNVWHNEEGFPIENTWAAADPRSFRLTYENPLVRIFAVELPEGAQ